MALEFIEEKTNKDGWDEFIAENSGDFLESWNWGEMQKNEGSPVWRFLILRNGQKIGAFQAYRHNTRIGAYIYIPRGPVFASGQYLSRDEQYEFAGFLKRNFSEYIFTLCEPLKESDLGDLRTFQNLQPERTLMIDLTKPMEEIRKEIVYSRRQGIGFSEKRGVKISNSNSKEYFEIFSTLIRKTGVRQGFGIFDAEHYENILKYMPSEIFAAKKENSSLAAALVVFWGRTATYLHAGSDDANKKLRAPDLMIWKIIEDAKNHGFRKFDFWGIDEKRWLGVTTFKKSFGGNEVRYGKARVIVNQPLKFLAYSIYKNLRKAL